VPQYGTALAYVAEAKLHKLDSRDPRQAPEVVRSVGGNLFELFRDAANVES